MLEAQRRMYGPVSEYRTSLAIRPKGQGRPRFGKGHTYTPPTTRKYIEALRSHFKTTWGDRDTLTGALLIRVDAEFEMPKSAKRKPRRYHTQRPDVDNVAKAVLDALMPEKRRGKIVWPGVIADDAIVVELVARKHWTVEEDMLHIQIWGMP